jgi:CubicO group peptidase (beta-lactamase class C family)
MLADEVDSLAREQPFSGVVRVDRPDQSTFIRAFGEADRALGASNTPQTRFGLASGVKAMTALVVVALVEQGILSLETRARPLLGEDLPTVDDDVTVEQLLAHRSGIGDYLDEDSDIETNDYLMTVPVHALAETEDYVEALGRFPAKFPPGTDFSYCNSGYVVLALLAERATGRRFRDLLEEMVCRPAGMTETAYLRSDELPGIAAKGYLETEGLRTNVLHLPVRGSGDGGVYSTVGDVHRLWAALQAGRIVPSAWVEEMARPRSSDPEDGTRYGLGLRLDAAGDGRMMVGSDAGVSFTSWTSPSRGSTWTVVSNVSDGAWPMVELVGTWVDAAGA